MRLLACLFLLAVFPASATAAPAFEPGAPTTLQDGAVDGYDIAAAPAEAGFLAVWAADGMTAQRYDAAGVADGEPTGLADAGQAPSVAYDVSNEEFVVASQRPVADDSTTRVVIQRIGLMASDPVALFKDPADNRGLVVRCGSETCVAAWYDAGRKRVLARSITADGPVGDTAIRLSRRGTVRNSYGDVAGSIDILPTDTGFLVSWSHSNGRQIDIHGRVLDAAGAPAGKELTLVDAGRRFVPFGPRLCSGADGPPLLVWFGALGKPERDGLYAQAFDPAGGEVLGDDNRKTPRIRASRARGSFGVSDAAEAIGTGDCVVVYSNGRKARADVLSATGEVERRPAIPNRYAAARLAYSPTAGVAIAGRADGARDLFAVTLPGT